MPHGTYSLHERALHTVLSADERDARQLITAFEWIAENPVGAAVAAVLNEEGHVRYAVGVGEFTILYAIARSGRHVFITDVRLALRGDR